MKLHSVAESVRITAVNTFYISLLIFVGSILSSFYITYENTNI